MLDVYLGWDSNEVEAYRVAESSLIANSSLPVRATPLNADTLYQWGMLWRPVEQTPSGMVDVLSRAPQSTEFASSRFLVPFLHRSGWALFADCDVVFLGDVAELFALADPRYAIMCVKHDHAGGEGTKMGGHQQTQYSRKNWSSVVLWNCDHPAHGRLSVPLVNSYPGSLLHRFFWLKDEEIGSLPEEWNWLVGVQDEPSNPKLAHFTLGGPWISGWSPAKHDDIWLNAAGDMDE